MYPLWFECTFPDHVPFSNCYFLQFLYFKYLLSRSRLCYSLQVQWLPFHPELGFHQDRLSSSPQKKASIILKETLNQSNKPGCLRSAHIKELLYYTGSTYIHVLFFEISAHPCVCFFFLHDSKGIHVVDK